MRATRTSTPSILQELIERADARLENISSNLTPLMPPNPGGAVLSKSELEQKIAALQERQDWHKELLEQLDSGSRSRSA